MRTLIKEMSNIGLNYGNSIPGDIEHNIIVVLSQRYTDINGFVAELICHLKNNPELINYHQVANSLQGNTLCVWAAICCYCGIELDNIPKIPELTIKSFRLELEGEDPIFKKFNIICAKPEFATAFHHSNKKS